MASDAQAYFTDGLELYRTGDFDSAMNAFQAALNADKRSWPARLYLGMCYARVGKPREAKNEFLSVRDFCPDPELRKKAIVALAAMAPTASH